MRLPNGSVGMFSQECFKIYFKIEQERDER